MDEIDKLMNYIDMRLSDCHLRINRFERAFCAPEWQWRHDVEAMGWRGMIFWLICAGSGHLRAGDSEYDLSHGDCFLLRMTEPLIATHDPEDPLVVPWIHFDVLDGDGAFLFPDRERMATHRKVRDITFLSTLFDRCVEAWR